MIKKMKIGCRVKTKWIIKKQIMSWSYQLSWFQKFDVVSEWWELLPNPGFDNKSRTVVDIRHTHS